MCVAYAGQSPALPAPSGAHCHPRGSRGHGLAWLCWAQPADWAGLGAQVCHSGVMGTPENWCQIMISFLQTTGVVTLLSGLGRGPWSLQAPRAAVWLMWALRLPDT